MKIKIKELSLAKPAQETPKKPLWTSNLDLLITSFKCGGVTLGINFHHSLVDGLSTVHFINTWADIARRGSSTSIRLLPPLHDRTLLQARNPPAPAFHHIEYDPSPSMIMNTTHLDPQSNSTCTSAVFKVSSEQHNMLKKHKLTSSSTSTGAKYSSYETLAAHIWRCTCKARGLANDQPTKLYLPVDGRSRLNPPLPPGFFGNAIFSATSTALAGDIQSEPLIDTVGRIYEAVKRIDDDYIRSALDYLQVQPDLAPLSRGAHTFKCPNLNVNSWSRLPMHDADFGWGRPVYTGPPSVVLEGMCFILPKSTNDGSLSLAICLETSHMQLFKDCFYDFS
ncbi:hypothetical protein Q3G72_034556 [Acer saccharum]|nr:hypothetical protein Q3G72_034556 [Acer saccharum]